MIHAIRLEDGRASYRNRWVESRGLAEERAAGHALFPGIFGIKATEAPTFKNTANTNIVWHAGKLLALVEASLPDAARAPTRCDTSASTTSAAARRRDDRASEDRPGNGRDAVLRLRALPAYLQYHVADRDGALVRHEVIDLAWPSMMHDFAITKDHVVFMLCPIVFSFGRHRTSRRRLLVGAGARHAARRHAAQRRQTPTCAGSTPTPATSSIRMNAYEENGGDRRSTSRATRGSTS